MVKKLQKMAEKKARPVWLYAVLGALVIALGGGGYMIYSYIQKRDQQDEMDRIAQEKKDAERDKQVAGLMAELKGLQEEQARIAKQKEDIEGQLKNVKDETERQRLLAEKAALDQQLAANEEKQKKNKGKTSTAKTGSGEPKPEKSKGGITVTKNVDDPLDGL